MTHKPPVFIDTNIFVYAISSGSANSAKIETSRNLLLHENWCWSTQVAFEFFSVTTRPSKGPLLTLEEAKRYLEVWMVYPIIGMTPQRFLKSVQLKETSGISIWDAAIISCAQDMNCGVLYTEDLNAGQRFGNVEVVNPFSRES
jgi:predicted nucleic acid-binding protein